VGQIRSFIIIFDRMNVLFENMSNNLPGNGMRRSISDKEIRKT
jgi:hypothetical protein